MSEQGSDNQMTPEQTVETNRTAELDLAAELEEDRKTAAAPADGPD